MYRSKKYLNFIRNSDPCMNGDGDTVPHHVKFLKGGGTGIKPPDTHVIPICDYVHKKIHSPGNSEKSVMTEYGFSEYQAKMQIFSSICDYLNFEKNIDGLKLAIDLLTKHMEDNDL